MVARPNRLEALGFDQLGKADAGMGPIAGLSIAFLAILADV